MSGPFFRFLTNLPPRKGLGQGMGLGRSCVFPRRVGVISRPPGVQSAPFLGSTSPRPPCEGQEREVAAPCYGSDGRFYCHKNSALASLLVFSLSLCGFPGLDLPVSVGPCALTPCSFLCVVRVRATNGLWPQMAQIVVEYNSLKDDYC